MSVHPVLVLYVRMDNSLGSFALSQKLDARTVQLMAVQVFCSRIPLATIFKGTIEFAIGLDLASPPSFSATAIVLRGVHLGYTAGPFQIV